MINVNEFEKKQILFIFLNRGEKMSFSNDNIVVKDSEGKIKHQSTCYRIFAVFLIGHMTLTSGIIQRTHKFNFPIVLMTHGMRIYGIIGHKTEGNVLLRRKQYAHNGLQLAKRFTLNKLENQRWTLNQQRDKAGSVKEAITKIDQYTAAVKNYDGDPAGLLGLEGSAARIYFKNHFNNIEWSGRRPRIKNDFVNSTLDIGYTLIFNVLEGLLNLYGFDIYQGVLHKQFYMRKSLVCDFVEPFRPLIDIQVKKAINLRQCKEDDFFIVNERYLLKWEKNTEYISFLMEPILEHKRQIFLYVQDYYRKFMKQADPEEFPMFQMV